MEFRHFLSVLPIIIIVLIEKNKKKSDSVDIEMLMICFYELAVAYCRIHRRVFCAEKKCVTEFALECINSVPFLIN